MLEKFSYDQSRGPRKGDVVSYFHLNCKDWMRVQIISMQKPSSVHCDYYNVRFLDLDREDDGIYLEPGSYWTFGSPVPLDQLPQGEFDTERLKRIPLLKRIALLPWLFLLVTSHWFLPQTNQRHNLSSMILYRVSVLSGNPLTLRQLILPVLLFQTGCTLFLLSLVVLLTYTSLTGKF